MMFDIFQDGELFHAFEVYQDGRRLESADDFDFLAHPSSHTITQVTRDYKKVIISKYHITAIAERERLHRTVFHGASVPQTPYRFLTRVKAPLPRSEPP